MQTDKSVIMSLLAGLILALPAAAIHAATVTFTNINDTDPTGGFVVGATTVVGDSYVIDVSGFDAVADNANNYDNIIDTIAFDILAPTGYYISSVSYSESAQATITSGDTGSFGVAIVAGTAVIDGSGHDLGFHAWTSDTQGDSLSTGVISVPGQKSTVAISITNQLTAVATGGAMVEIRKGFDALGNAVPSVVSVQLSQVPLPSAIWLFGSALLGLAAVGRRGHGGKLGQP